MKLSELFGCIDAHRAEGVNWYERPGDYVVIVTGFDASGDAFALVQDEATGDATLYVSAGSDLVEQTYTKPAFLLQLADGFNRAAGFMVARRAREDGE